VEFWKYWNWNKKLWLWHEKNNNMNDSKIRNSVRGYLFRSLHWAEFAHSFNHWSWTKVNKAKDNNVRSTWLSFSFSSLGWVHSFVKHSVTKIEQKLTKRMITTYPYQRTFLMFGTYPPVSMRWNHSNADGSVGNVETKWLLWLTNYLWKLWLYNYDKFTCWY